jgi:hypothetical protein
MGVHGLGVHVLGVHVLGVHDIKFEYINGKRNKTFFKP